MDIVLRIALVLLVIAGAWVLVEVALTVKRSRENLADISKQLEGTLEEVKPILNNIDTTLSNIQPTVQELQPLLNKAGTTIDAVSLNLLRVDEILADVSDITTSAAHASSALGSAATNASGAANQAINKIRTKLSGKSKAEKVEKALSDGQVAQAAADQEYLTIEPAVASGDEGYFTYPAQ